MVNFDEVDVICDDGYIERVNKLFKFYDPDFKSEFLQNIERYLVRDHGCVRTYGHERRHS